MKTLIVIALLAIAAVAVSANSWPLNEDEYFPVDYDVDSDSDEDFLGDSAESNESDEVESRFFFGQLGDFFRNMFSKPTTVAATTEATTEATTPAAGGR